MANKQRMPTLNTTTTKVEGIDKMPHMQFWQWLKYEGNIGTAISPPSGRTSGSWVGNCGIIVDTRHVYCGK